MDTLTKSFKSLESPTKRRRKNTITTTTEAAEHAEYALKDGTAERLKK
jgi:hypothetical protein